MSANGSTSQRGYGWRHQVARARVAPIVAAGRAICSRCHQPIRRWQAWDLDHADRPDAKALGLYRGPSHRFTADCLAGGNRATARHAAERRRQRPQALSWFDTSQQTLVNKAEAKQDQYPPGGILAERSTPLRLSASPQVRGQFFALDRPHCRSQAFSHTERICQSQRRATAISQQTTIGANMGDIAKTGEQQQQSGPSLADLAQTGDRPAILRALRDRLAADLDETTDAREVAALAGRLTAVLAEIDAMPTTEGKGPADEIAKRRAAAARRRRSAKDPARAPRSG